MTFASWLNSNEQFRCVLVEVNVLDTTEKTLYFSSRPFQNGATKYIPILKGDSITIQERLSLNSGAGLSIGDIELDNKDGSIDSYLNYVWASRECKVYIGDVRWIRSDFQLIFDGITEDIGTRSRDTLNIKIRDKLQRLDSPMSETVLGGSTPNKEQLLPLCFGEVHNITPLLTNPATLEFQYHQSASEGVIEVRDNGVPVGYTDSPSTGKFTLTATPFGQLTASIQGDKPSTWNTTIAPIIERIVKNYGHTSTRFTASDIDSSNFSNFESANTEKIGIYLDTSETVLSVCSQIASANGAQIIMSRLGKLQLHKIDLSGTPIETITDNDIIASTLFVSQKLPVQGSFRIGYCRNWTVQTPLDTRIVPAHKDMFAKEWYEVKAENSTVKTNYKQLVETERVDTLLLTEADAQSYANDLLALYSVPRFVFSVQVNSRLLEIELGSLITLKSNRFGLNAGSAGQIIGKNINYGKGTITLEILV